MQPHPMTRAQWQQWQDVHSDPIGAVPDPFRILALCFVCAVALAVAATRLQRRR